MTPCEKLGYKVGDKFEVVAHHAFKRGQVVNLLEDDGTRIPKFSGDGGTHTDVNGVVWSFAALDGEVKPLTTAKLHPAKQALADAIHASGKSWPDGANWAAQGGNSKDIGFISGDTKPRIDMNYRGWVGKSGDNEPQCRIPQNKLLPNWHQTVLSRDEYFSAYPEKVEPVADNPMVTKVTEAIKRAVYNIISDKPSTDTLLTAWQSAQVSTREARAALEAAEQAEREAEEAVKAELGKYGWGESVVESVPEQLVITDWRDLKVGDLVKVVSSLSGNREGEIATVTRFDEGDKGREVRVHFNNDPSDYEWCEDWEFIRRP